jgi:hypothetical protein
MSRTPKDPTKLRFLDKLFDAKDEPIKANYILMTDKSVNPKPLEEENKDDNGMLLVYIILILFAFSSLTYLIFNKNYTYQDTICSVAGIIFVVLFVLLAVDYFYLRRYNDIYSKFTLKNLKIKKDKKKIDDEEYCNNYQLLDI